MNIRPGARAGAALVCLALGCLLVAEGVLAERCGVGERLGFGWGRAALIAVGACLTLAGLAMAARGWVPRPGRATIVRAGRTCWPLLLALAVYLCAFLVIKPIAVGDQPHYELESMSLAYDHDRNLANNYADPAQYHVMFGLFVPNREAFAYTDPHTLILEENVGLPLILTLGVPWVALLQPGAHTSVVPLWAFLTARSPWNIEIVILAALAAALLHGLLRRFRPDAPGLTTAVWACAVFCAPMTVYASQIYPEIPALLLALIAVDCLTRSPTAASGAIGASAASAMPWLHVRFFVVAVLLVLGLAARAIAHGRSQRRTPGSLVSALLPVAVPLVVSIAAMAVAFQAWYGSPLIDAPYRIAQTRQPQTLASSYLAITSLFLNPRDAALPFAPVFVLSLVGIPLCCRRYGRWALYGVLVATAYVLTVTVEGSGIGASFPGRYTVWLIPFAAVPLLFLVTEFRLARTLFMALATVTAYLTLAVVIEPPSTLSSAAGPAGAWSALVDVWPTIDPSHPYANVATVIAWVAGLLVAAAVVYAARPRRHPRGSRRVSV